MTYINGLDVNRGIKNISKHEDKEDIYMRSGMSVQGQKEFSFGCINFETLLSINVQKLNWQLYIYELGVRRAENLML